MRTRRVGSLTAGIALVATGIIFLVHTLAPKTIILMQSLKFWPVVLIMLGVEILVDSFSKKEGRKYDFLSIIMMLLCIAFAFACEISRQALIFYYGS